MFFKESNMTARAPSPLRTLPLAKACITLAAVCLAGHVNAQTAPYAQPTAAAAASTETGSGNGALRAGKPPGNGAAPLAKRREGVSRAQPQPTHYPSSPLPPVPAPPAKR
jgi:hypothetical protein